MGVPLPVSEQKNGNRGRSRYLVYTASFAMVFPGRIGETSRSNDGRAGVASFMGGFGGESINQLLVQRKTLCHSNG